MGDDLEIYRMKIGHFYQSGMSSRQRNPKEKRTAINVINRLIFAFAVLLLYQGLSVSHQAHEGLMSTPVAGSLPWSATTTCQNATTGFMRNKYTVTPLNPVMQTQCDLKYGSFCPRVPAHLYGLHRSSVIGQGETKQLFNIIKSGDVQPNPGPVKNPCRVCQRAVARTHRSLRCCSCFYDVHIKCAEVNAQTFTHNIEYYIP